MKNSITVLPRGSSTRVEFVTNSKGVVRRADTDKVAGGIWPVRFRQWRMWVQGRPAMQRITHTTREDALRAVALASLHRG